MLRCEMWCNGLLHTLEIYPRFCGRCRLVSHASGVWIVDRGHAEPYEARLVRGWMLGGGRVGALTLASPDGRKINAWLLARDHGRDTWRRLLVRLHWPGRLEPGST